MKNQRKLIACFNEAPPLTLLPADFKTRLELKSNKSHADGNQSFAVTPQIRSQRISHFNAQTN